MGERQIFDDGVAKAVRSKLEGAPLPQIHAEKGCDESAGETPPRPLLWRLLMSTLWGTQPACPRSRVYSIYIRTRVLG